MAWNGSDQSSRKGEATSKSLLKGKSIATTKSLRLRLVASTLILLALAGAAVWCFLRPAPSPKIKQSKQSRNQTIQSVTPAPARTNAVAKVEEKVKESKQAKEKKEHDYRYDVPEGAYRAPNGRLYTATGRRILERPPARHIKLYDENKPRVFKHMAENEILRVISQKEGMMPLPSYYGVAFEKSFMESMASPIEISPEDSDEVKQKKQDMIQIKKELAQRIKEGEDICDIMRKTQDEFKQLALYKDDLMKTAKELVTTTEMTEQDIDDYTTAVNKILQERGAQPVSSKLLHVYREKYLSTQNGGEK